MDYVLASDGLAPWGQAAAIVLALYLFVSIIVGLALTAALMFGLAWIREKAELLRQLRPQVMQINRAAIAAKRGDPLPSEVADNKIVSTIVQVPKIAGNVAARTSSIEQTVDHGSQRVANVVIEFYARTAMVKGMARAFFLPGLTKARPVAPVVQTVKQPEPEAEQIQVVQAPQEERPLEQEIVITQSSR
jgi:hypothetical protein